MMKINFQLGLKLVISQPKNSLKKIIIKKKKMKKYLHYRVKYMNIEKL